MKNKDKYKQNNIRRLSKKDLLELLVLQSKKIDKLEEELCRVNELLNDKQIIISEAGSIAEASLKLNKVFEVAQQAANQYLENIKVLGKRKSNTFSELEYNKIRHNRWKK